MSIKGIGKVCAASFPTPGDLTGTGPVTIRVNDTSCLLKADNSATGVGDVIYFPEFQLAQLASYQARISARGPNSSAVFLPPTHGLKTKPPRIASSRTMSTSP